MEELRFTYILPDYIAACRLNFRHSALFWFYVALGVLGLVFAIVAALSGNLVAAVLLAVCVLFFPGFKYWYLPMWCKRAFERNPQLQGEVAVQFDDNALTMNSAAGASEAKHIRRCVASDVVTLFYPKDKAFIMFPRRVFASDEQYRRFQQLGEKLAQTPAPSVTE